jgi:hypothetical protein
MNRRESVIEDLGHWIRDVRLRSGAQGWLTARPALGGAAHPHDGEVTGDEPSPSSRGSGTVREGQHVGLT